MSFDQNRNVEIRDSGVALKSFTKAEVNFLCLPYFCLHKKPDPGWMIEFTEKHQRGPETFEAIWTVIPHPDFGAPGDFERQLQRAVEYCLAGMPRPIRNPVPLPGFRELARIMGMKCPGKFVRQVKQGLTRMMKTQIRSKRSYYSKSIKNWIEKNFHLYEHIVFAGETLPDGRKADGNYVYFHNAYLDNVNALYVRPLDFEYLKSLKPVSARLYEILGVKFYGHNEYIQYKYSTLCRLLAIPQKKVLSRARRQLDAAHDELNLTRFLSHWEWLPIQGEKHDWYIRYVPGKRFFNEATMVKMATANSGGRRRIPMIKKEPSASWQNKSHETGENNQTDPLSLSLNEPETEPLWSLFSGIIKKYPEFELWRQDREWFRLRVETKSDFQPLNLTEEIENWGDWLATEYRKKIGGNSHKFPQSNFKGNLMNWLKQSLNAVMKENNSRPPLYGTEPVGRKGWDLPSDYRIDIM